MKKLEPQSAPSVEEEVPWTTQQTFLVILITLVARVLFSLGLSGGSSTTSTPLSPNVDLASAILSFFLTGVIQSFFLIGPFYFASRSAKPLRQRLRTMFEVLGFRAFPLWRSLAWIALLFVGFLVINQLYLYAIDLWHLKLQTNDQVYYEMSKRAPITISVLLFLSVFIAPICEEVFFRSFVFPGLLRGMPLGAAIVFSALIFAVAHGDVGSFLVLFVIGLGLAFLRWRTRSIWPGIILHLLNNAVASLTILLPMLGLIKR